MTWYLWVIIGINLVIGSFLAKRFIWNSQNAQFNSRLKTLTMILVVISLWFPLGLAIVMFVWSTILFVIFLSNAIGRVYELWAMIKVGSKEI